MRPKGAWALREAVGRNPSRVLAVAVAALLGGLLAPGRPALAALPPRDVPVVYNSGRSFRIPFDVGEETRKRIAEVHLYVSTDGGLMWDYAGAAAPESPSFPFRASRDGEYWFAVRTRDTAGRLYPPGEDSVVPKLKVFVDTVSPVVRVVPQPRRGSEASIRWEVQDDNIDLKTLTVEYQVQGAPADSWRMVQITRRPVGEARWDAGNALPLTVRVSVEDKAGNRQSVERILTDGLAGPPLVQNAAQGGGPPPIQPIPYQEPASPSNDPDLAGNPFENLEPQAATQSSPVSPSPRPSNPPLPNASDLAQRRADPNSPPSAGADGTLLVGSPRFPIQYEVYEGEPDAVGVVEMWVTRDNGATWQFLGTDPDRQSPFQVDVGGEGRFGLYLVVQSPSGLGDPRPASGDPPHMLVEVDSTPPQITLGPPQLGTGNAAGSLLITWQASDPHLAERPIVLSIRPAQEGAIWQQITPPIPNSGRYVWALPTNLPPRFFLRIDAFDTLGNQNAAETPEPVTLQVARPRGRILGLDPSARTNSGKVR